MGRPKGSKNKPKDGHVTEHAKVTIEDLTDEQHHCLVLQHDRKVATAEAAAKLAQTAVKNARNLAKAELGPDGLKTILAYRALQSEHGQTALKAIMGMQAMVARWAGMAVGHIDDLFSPDRTPIDDRTFAEGKRAGMAGDDPTPPHELDGPRQAKWTEGYHAGQSVNTDMLRNMPKPKGRDLDEDGQMDVEDVTGKPAENEHYAMGCAARERSDGGVIPDGLNKNEGSEWLRGWSETADKIKARPKTVDYHAQGRAAFLAGESIDVPDAVPPHQRGTWKQGWNEAKVSGANERVKASARAAHA